MRYFLYCRKSTDREDKQVLSTEAQQRLLAEHAGRLRLAVAGTFVENQSAYKRGRPRFEEMLARLEAGEADAVLTYHLTRLARNSFDGGRIIYMMDERTIRQIATPERAYTDNPDDKFMMQIHFAMAKKSSDDTSQFVQRDIESKLLRGEYPGWAPLGYLNITPDGSIARTQADRRKTLLLLELGRPLRRVEVDPIDGPLVQRLFHEAARGVHGLEQLRKLSYRLGLRARRSGKMLGASMVEQLLRNPFYHGAIAYGGRVYDTALIRERTGDPRAGVRHEPLVTRHLFERVQEALAPRRRAGRYRRHAFTFGGGLLRCGECGGPVTAERQKGHVYYHCTGNNGPCAQRRGRWAREDGLREQVDALLRGLRLPQEFLDYALEKLRVSHRKEAQFTAALRRKLRMRVEDGQRRLDALLELRISPANAGGALLDDEEYLARKAAIRREQEDVQEELRSVEARGDGWLGDCERFFRLTQRLADEFERAGAEGRRAILLGICSNLTLRDGRLAFVRREPFAALAEFPLSRTPRGRGFEPGFTPQEAENPGLAEKWLHLLSVIRTAPTAVSWLAGAEPPPRGPGPARSDTGAG